MEQLPDGALGHFLGMQVHAGQGRIRVGTEELVVAADDRHIPGKGEAHFLQLVDGAQGHQVVEGGDGGGPAAPGKGGQQADHRPLAAFHIIAGVHMVGGIVGKVQEPELLQEAGAPAGGVLAVHGAADEGDAPVAQVHKMLDRQAGAVDQVALDADAVQGHVGRADGGHGHILPQLPQGGIQVPPVGGPDAAGEEDPVHPAADQLLHDGGGDGLVFHGLEQADAAAAALRLPVGRVENAVEIQVGNHGQHQGDGAAAAALQVLGGDAGGVGVAVDDLLHLLPCGLPDAGIPPDHPGNRCRGDPGLPGDIINRYFPLHGSRSFPVFK